ncbi:MAG: RNA polymerase sigma factor [Brumimicrobium sp.]|nr:RNA polymerase sigma factor [Brumimicrobium sp.]
MHVDTDLLKACIKNKRKAQEELYKACFSFLMPICRRYHRNNEDARSMYNLAFVKIIDNLPKLNIDEIPFASWAKRVMTNTLIDEYRKNKRYTDKVGLHEDERMLEYFSTPIENKAETNFNESSVLRLLDYLKPATRQVFMLYVIEGYNHKEIGEIMDMSEGTSKWHLSIARKELKEMIEKQQEGVSKNVAI